MWSELHFDGSAFQNIDRDILPTPTIMHSINDT